MLAHIQDCHQHIGGPAATVEAYVDHDTIFAQAAGGKFPLKALKTWPVHSLDMDVPQASAGVLLG